MKPPTRPSGKSGRTPASPTSAAPPAEGVAPATSPSTKKRPPASKRTAAASAEARAGNLRETGGTDEDAVITASALEKRTIPVIRDEVVPPNSNRIPRRTSDERQRLIARAAYFRSERRGFAPGHEVEDWLWAEREVDKDGAA